MAYNHLDSQRTQFQLQYQYLVCILHDINIFESLNILILDIISITIPKLLLSNLFLILPNDRSLRNVDIASEVDVLLISEK